MLPFFFTQDCKSCGAISGKLKSYVIDELIGGIPTMFKYDLESKYRMHRKICNPSRIRVIRWRYSCDEY